MSKTKYFMAVKFTYHPQTATFRFPYTKEKSILFHFNQFRLVIHSQTQLSLAWLLSFSLMQSKLWPDFKLSPRVKGLRGLVSLIAQFFTWIEQQKEKKSVTWAHFFILDSALPGVDFNLLIKGCLALSLSLGPSTKPGVTQHSLVPAETLLT